MISDCPQQTCCVDYRSVTESDDGRSDQEPLDLVSNHLERATNTCYVALVILLGRICLLSLSLLKGGGKKEDTRGMLSEVEIFEQVVRCAITKHRP